MVVFPNAKVNLGLQILSKREDGFHEISSCLYPIGLSDILEAVPSDKEGIAFSGIQIAGPVEDNLVWKAYNALRSDFDIPPTQFHLHKIIPSGAGLGGGSSDAAHAIKLLNELYDLELTSNALEGYAAQLGSDVPFFIENTPAMARGTGTTLSSFPIDLSEYSLLVVVPPVHISTPSAYKQAFEYVSTLEDRTDMESCLRLNPEDWRGCLENDFQPWLLEAYPEIANVINKMESSGALYAQVTGSGAGVFGVFSGEVSPPPFPQDHFVWSS